MNSKNAASSSFTPGLWRPRPPQSRAGLSTARSRRRAAGVIGLNSQPAYRHGNIEVDKYTIAMRDHPSRRPVITLRPVRPTLSVSRRTKQPWGFREASLLWPTRSCILLRSCFWQSNGCGVEIRGKGRQAFRVGRAVQILRRPGVNDAGPDHINRLCPTPAFRKGRASGRV